MVTESRTPIALPSYTLGDDGRPAHFTATTPRETAAVEAKELAVGDAAFILRSGHKWAYAIVIEKVEKDGGTILRFEVDMEKNQKTFPEAVWGKYIRVIRVDANELAKLEAEAGELENAPKEASSPKKVAESKEEATNEKKKEAKKGESKSATLVLGEFSSEVGSWFYSKWNSKKTKEDKPAALVSDKRDTQKPEPKDKAEPPSGEPEDQAAVATAKEKTKSKPQTGSLFSSKPELGSMFASMFGEKSGEPKSDPEKKDEVKAAAATQTDADKPNSQTDESKLTQAKVEKSKESKPAALGSMFASMFGEKSGEPKSDPKDKEDVKDAPVTEVTKVTKVDRAKPKTQTEESEVTQAKIEKSEKSQPAAAAANQVTTTEQNKDPSPASSLASGKPPEAAADETRDAVEEKPTPAPAAPTTKAPVEGKSTLAPAAPILEPPAPQPVPPKPIKLLKTPFKFYKARSMKEDPAAAALAATSFADDIEGYGSIENHGVAICKYDPAAAANADVLAEDREHGGEEIQGDTIEESNAELKRQGIVVVEAE